MEKENPFTSAAAQGALNRETDILLRQTAQSRWESHLEACRVILVNSAESRLVLAQEAMVAWEHVCEVKPVFRIETLTGAVLFRTAFFVSACDYLELTVSPKRQVITAVGHSNHRKRRWPLISISAEGITGHIDDIIKEFLQWWK